MRADIIANDTKFWGRKPRYDIFFITGLKRCNIGLENDKS